MNQIKNGGRALGRPGFAKTDGLAAEAFMRAGRRIVLSRQANTPLWQQLSDQLENLILSGKLTPNSRIPPETALCELFNVSLPVVRSAIGALASRGLVVKIPRKGMFVGDPPRESGFITANVSLFDDMLARGVRLKTQTFEFYRAKADDKEQAALQLREDADVVRVARVFWTDEIPITYTRMSFPADKVPGLETIEIEGRSILGVVREHFGRRVARADRWFRAAMPDEDAQTRMGVTADMPLIWIESLGFENDGSPLEFYRAYYNSNAALIHFSVSDP